MTRPYPWKHALTLLSAGVAAVWLVPAPCAAQAQQAPQATDPSNYPIDLSMPFQKAASEETSQKKPGSLAATSVGTAGQRRDKNQGVANIKPMGRLQSRIASRVQSRIRNRIDRFYDPQANAQSPFVVAAEQANATR